MNEAERQVSELEDQAKEFFQNEFQSNQPTENVEERIRDIAGTSRGSRGSPRGEQHREQRKGMVHKINKRK